MLMVIGHAVLTYWGAAGIVRGALQAAQGIALAAGCIANGNAQAGLACLVGGAAAPGVGVLHEVEQTVESLKIAALAIGRPAASPFPSAAGWQTTNHQRQAQCQP